MDNYIEVNQFKSQIKKFALEMAIKACREGAQAAMIVDAAKTFEAYLIEAVDGVEPISFTELAAKYAAN